MENAASDDLTVAVIQVETGADKLANLELALSLTHEALDAGAQLLVLPELFTYLSPAAGFHEAAEPIPGQTITTFSDLALARRAHIVVGSIVERDESGTLYNTSVLIDASGTIAAKYRKIHMSELDIADVVSDHESSFFATGNEFVVARVENHTMGMSICRDLRFPELYRSLLEAGAEILAVPAAWSMFTGKDHWEILLRARAIENQCFVLAADQHGDHPEGRSFGRSMIIDPWGTVLAGVPDGAGFAVATLNFHDLTRVRRELPRT